MEASTKAMGTDATTEPVTAVQRSTPGPTEILRWLVLVNGIGDLPIAVAWIFGRRRDPGAVHREWRT
jgi:hypothetical protein